MEWKFEKSGLDGQCELYGVNIFDYDWQSTGETAWVDDPHYGQSRVLRVYRAVIAGSSVPQKLQEFYTDFI